MTDDLMTDVAAIAKELGVSRSAVYRMAKTGQGPVQKIGRKLYSRTAWITRYKAGEPGFWTAIPQQDIKPYQNPFLRKVA
jgi:predicted DNA-binding transcriptional regulator AlpA